MSPQAMAVQACWHRLLLVSATGLPRQWGAEDVFWTSLRAHELQQRAARCQP